MESPLLSISDVYPYRNFDEETKKTIVSTNITDNNRKEESYFNHTSMLYFLVFAFACLALTALLFALL